MKKISFGHDVTTSTNKVAVLKDANLLLEKHNLKIQFEDSIYYNDDMTAKDNSNDESPQNPTRIVLYEIEDIFDRIIKDKDINALKKQIEKSNKLKAKIDETIEKLKK